MKTPRVVVRVALALLLLLGILPDPSHAAPAEPLPLLKVMKALEKEITRRGGAKAYRGFQLRMGFTESPDMLAILGQQAKDDLAAWDAIERTLPPDPDSDTADEDDAASGAYVLSIGRRMLPRSDTNDYEDGQAKLEKELGAIAERISRQAQEAFQKSVEERLAKPIDEEKLSPEERFDEGAVRSGMKEALERLVEEGGARAGSAGPTTNEPQRAAFRDPRSAGVQVPHLLSPEERATPAGALLEHGYERFRAGDDAGAIAAFGEARAAAATDGTRALAGLAALWVGEFKVRAKTADAGQTDFVDALRLMGSESDPLVIARRALAAALLGRERGRIGDVAGKLHWLATSASLLRHSGDDPSLVVLGSEELCAPTEVPMPRISRTPKTMMEAFSGGAGVQTQMMDAQIAFEDEAAVAALGRLALRLSAFTDVPDEASGRSALFARLSECQGSVGMSAAVAVLRRAASNAGSDLEGERSYYRAAARTWRRLRHARPSSSLLGSSSLAKEAVANARVTWLVVEAELAAAVAAAGDARRATHAWRRFLTLLEREPEASKGMGELAAMALRGLADSWHSPKAREWIRTQRDVVETRTREPRPHARPALAFAELARLADALDEPERSTKLFAEADMAAHDAWQRARISSARVAVARRHGDLKQASAEADHALAEWHRALTDHPPYVDAIGVHSSERAAASEALELHLQRGDAEVALAMLSEPSTVGARRAATTAPAAANAHTDPPEELDRLAEKAQQKYLESAMDAARQTGDWNAFEQRMKSGWQHKFGDTAQDVSPHRILLEQYRDLAHPQEVAAYERIVERWEAVHAKLSRRARDEALDHMHREVTSEGTLATTDEAASAPRKELLERLAERDRAQRLVAASPAATSEELRERLDPESTLVAYVLAREASYALVLGDQPLAIVPLSVTAGKVRRAVEIIRQSKEDDPTKELADLYDWLLRPIADRLTRPIVQVVARGPVRYVPFIALSDGARVAGERWVFAELERPEALVVPHTEETRPPVVAALAFDSPDGFAALEFADHEAETVGELFGITPAIGPAATEAAFRAATRSADVLHVAAHGDVVVRYPILSRLMLSPATDSDGALDIIDIGKLDLSGNDLVVLSACESRGRIVVDEHGGSLTSAFLDAGARSAVASLWHVADDSTAHLMRGFYERLRAGRSKAMALNEAALAMRESFPHPRQWAAFVLVGDPYGLRSRRNVKE